jgi:3-isopropylmalate/(R)-2-methylmalate dehydratase small subunit
MAATRIRGKVYVLGDNVDTDQIIPAQYLNLVPTIREEYEKLGGYALSGVLDAPPFVPAGGTKTPYPIIVAGRNFGCGSSREHAPIALGAAGGRAVVAESYARIFFRNCVATGELYPVETPTRLVGEFVVGDEAELDLDAGTLTNLRSGACFTLRPLGDARPVIDAGGLFAYARRTGMIPSGTPDSKEQVPVNTTIED